MSSPAAGDASLTLPTTLTIKSIATIRETILGFLDKNPVVLLDIDPAAQVDLSFVQLVTAARRQAEAKAGQVGLVRPATGELYDVLKRGGFLDGITPDTAHFWLHQEKN